MLFCAAILAAVIDPGPVTLMAQHSWLNTLTWYNLAQPNTHWPICSSVDIMLLIVDITRALAA